MRILLALDHSDSSATAVEYLANLRFVEPVDLEIVTVIVPVPLVALGVPPLIGAAVEDEKEYIIRRLARICDPITSSRRAAHRRGTSHLRGGELLRHGNDE